MARHVLVGLDIDYYRDNYMDHNLVAEASHFIKDREDCPESFSR